MIDFILAGQTLGEHASKRVVSAYVSLLSGKNYLHIVIHVYCYKNRRGCVSTYYKSNVTPESFPEDITAAHEAIDNYES